MTSGLRPDRYRAAAENPDSTAAMYEDFKSRHKDTESECRRQGIRFTPMVCEAHAGGWRLTARRVIGWIAHHSALVQGEPHARISQAIAQRIACPLQRDNARAVLRRIRATDQTTGFSFGWAGMLPDP